VNVLVGVISAVIVFYFRECLRLAHQQRDVAARLNSYLHYWTLKNFEGDDGLSRLSAIGYRWAEGLAKCKTSQEMLEIDDEFNGNLDKLLETGALNQEELQEIENSFSEIRDNPEYKKELIAYLKEYRRDILDGKIFPPDQEVAKLGDNFSKLIISFKMEQVNLIENLHTLFIYIDTKNSPYKLKDSTLKLIIKWVKLNRDKDMLIKMLDKFLEQKITERTFHNFIIGL